MYNHKYFLYLVSDHSDIRIRVTHDLKLDKEFWITRDYDHFIPLAGPLPLAHAIFISDCLRPAIENEPPVKFCLFFPKMLNKLKPKSNLLGNEAGCEARLNGIVRHIRRDVLGYLTHLGYDPGRYLIPATLCGSPLQIGPSLSCFHPSILLSEDNIPEILGPLEGRILLLREVKGALDRAGLVINAAVIDALQLACLMGLADFIPAISVGPVGMARCNRCGETHRIIETQCARCGNSHCLMCLECSSMGVSRMCEPLFIVKRQGDSQAGREKCSCKEDQMGTRPSCELARFKLPFSLTGPQEAASLALDDFMRSGSLKESLVWAVCGAGKTEVAFRAISRAICAGGNVLYCVPRKDVVSELAPRIAEAFTSIQVAELHAGAHRDVRGISPVGITVATTHQAIRFYQAFDLVVLDEADAYPYAGSRMLHHAVQRAARPDGKIIYMTATPSAELQKRVISGEIFLVKIPARHHGHPVPVPEIIYLNLPGDPDSRNDMAISKTMRIPGKVLETIEASLPAKLFIFVPTIRLTEAIGPSLQNAISRSRLRGKASVAWIHSGDESREEKIRRFKCGEINILVTTTIMERGITVPGVNVLVLYADYERIFDEGTLIQMAGRVGRTIEFPAGKVWFAAKAVSSAMRKAIHAISSMNEEARKLGHIW